MKRLEIPALKKMKTSPAKERGTKSQMKKLSFFLLGGEKEGQLHDKCGIGHFS